MKKNVLPILSVCLILLAGCGEDEESLSFEEQLAIDVEIIDNYLAENGITTEVDESGIRYIIEEEGNDIFASIGDDVAVKFSSYFLDGTLISLDTIGFTINLSSPLISSWQIMIPAIGEQGKIILYTPSGYAVGNRSVGSVPANTNIIYEIELLGVIENSEEQLQIDTLIIDEYLNEEGIQYEIDSTGIRYETLEEGTGLQPELTDRVVVKYEGFFLSGQIFDSNEVGAQFNLNVLIEAWKIMLPQMKEGGKIRIYAPSQYCYGSSRNGSIPPNTILAFEIELVSVN